MPRTKKEDTAPKRKSAARRKRNAAKSFETGHSANTVGKSRAEGIRLFTLAGRPS